MEWTLVNDRHRVKPSGNIYERLLDRTKYYNVPIRQESESFTDSFFQVTNGAEYVSETDFNNFVAMHKRPTRFLPCDHVHWSQNFGSETWYSKTAPRYGSKRFPFLSIYPAFMNRNPVQFYSNMYSVVSKASYDAAFHKAVEKITPSITKYIKTINLYTFVLELAEVLTIIPGILKSLTRGSLDRGVDAYIGTNFAILPMVSDIQAFYDIFTRLDDVIDRWNEAANAGSLHNEHATILDVTTTGDLPYWMGVGLNGPLTYTYNEVAKMHLYFVPKLITEDMRSNAWLKAFGLDQLFSGVWNAVPFSWAIDYFTNIGDMIESFDRELPNMFRFEFVDAGYSQKIMSEYSMTGKRDLGSIYSPRLGPDTAVTGLWRRYKRTVLSSDVFDEHITSVPNFSVDFDINTRQASYLVGVGRIITRKG